MDRGTGFPKYQKSLNAEQLAGEYAAWMKDRWNHPCVVIWDAQNESVNEVTGRAINKVRSLDLSDRPWDNGWSSPAGPGDAGESHPYLFSRYNWAPQLPGKNGVLADIFSVENDPNNGPDKYSTDSQAKNMETQ